MIPLGCAHIPAGMRGGGDVAGAGSVPPALWGSQHLFRLSIDAGGVDAGGRLILVLLAEGRWQLRAADALGRAAWALERGPDGWLVLDQRRARYCRGVEAASLPEPLLSAVPLASLPAVLLGNVPLPPRGAPDSAGRWDWLEPDGSRWTARHDGERWIAWTLWRNETPLAWWTRQTDGGILSHRDGSQVRWRRVVSEAAPARLAALAPPDGYREASCDEMALPELRQDQPPPPGGRAAG